MSRKKELAELNQTYNAALAIVAPYVDLPREKQLMGIAVSLWSMFDSGMIYSREQRAGAQASS